MAFTEVASLDADTTVSIGGFNKKTKKDNPLSAEGYYLGFRRVVTKTGDSKLHFLQTPKGNLGVWGKTDMDRKLEGVVPGTMIRVSFSRMQETPKGDMYVFKVEVDNDNTIDVSSLSQESSSGDMEEGYTEEGYDDGGDDAGSDDGIDDDAAQQMALADAERRARVQAALQKGKRK